MVQINDVYLSSSAVGAVIFVHGITGEYQETWKAPDSEGDPYWPNRLKHDFPNLSMFALNYPSKKTNWGGSTPPPIELAKPAYRSLKRIEKLQDKPLLFICHSMGGLIVKFMLRAAEFTTDDAFRLTEQTRGVVFIAVPHAGARKASIAAKVPLVRASDATKDMAWNHPYLSDLKDWYSQRSKPLGIKTWAYAAVDDKTVDPLSADPCVDGVLLEKRPGDHSSVCKFRSSEAELYQDICGILSEFQQDIEDDANRPDADAASKVVCSTVSEKGEMHGYALKSLSEPFPECAQLTVEPKQGTNQQKINAIAMLRCNRQRISKDDEVERAFYLSTKDIRLTIEVTGGELDPHLGIGDQNDDGRYSFARAANVLKWSAGDDDSFLEGFIHHEEWLPTINIHSYDDCEVTIRVGSYPEAVNLEICDSDHLQAQEVSDLKMKLMKVIVFRALEQVNDEIIFCRTDLKPAGLE